MIDSFSPLDWTLAGIAALCAGLAKSGIGGLGMVTILIMATLLPARESTGVVLPLLIIGDFFAVAIYRSHADWKQVLTLLPPAAVGVIAGFFLMPRIPSALFGPMIGWIVILLVAAQVLRPLWNRSADALPHHPAFAWSMGIFAGVATMLANAAGPVMTVYLLARGLPKLAFVGTAAVFFMIVNLFKVPFSAALGLIDPSSLALNLLLLPAVATGVLLGRSIVGRIPQKLFETLLLIFAAAGALRMILG